MTSLSDLGVIEDKPDDRPQGFAKVRQPKTSLSSLGIKSEEPEDTSLSFGQGFGAVNAEGEFNSIGEFGGELRKASIFGGIGEALTEQGIKKVNPELFELNQRSKAVRRWRNQIFDAEDNLAAMPNKNTIEYQQEFVNLQQLKKNFELDLKGEFVENTGDLPSFTEMIEFAGDNKAFMAGSLVKQFFADPALAVMPGGVNLMGARALSLAAKLTRSTKLLAAAKTTGQAVGAGSLGAGILVSENIGGQLEGAPNKELNFDSIEDAALLGFGFGAALPVAGKVVTSSATKLSQLHTKGKIKQIKADAQKIWFDSFEDGKPLISQRAAINKSIAKHDPQSRSAQLTKTVIKDGKEIEVSTGGKNSEEIGNLDSFLNESTIKMNIGRQELKRTVGEKAVDATIVTADVIGKAFNNLTQPITTALRNMGLVGISTSLVRNDIATSTDMGNKLGVASKFAKEMKKLSNEESDAVSLALFNGEIDSIEGMVSPELMTEALNVRKMLDDELIQINDVGMKLQGKENYIPRSFNYELFAKDNGLNLDSANVIFAKAINTKLNLRGKNQIDSKKLNDKIIRENLTEAEIGQAIANNIAKGTRLPPLPTASSSFKKRTVEKILPEDMKYYMSINEALHNHIVSTTHKIHTRRFFGGKQIEESRAGIDELVTDESLIAGYVSDYANRTINEGSMIPEQAGEVIRLLTARFNGAQKRPHIASTVAKNLMYAAILGNQIAASVQAADIAGAAYINTTMSALDGFVRTVARKNKVSLDDFGLESVLHDFDNTGVTRKILDWSLRKGSFSLMDRIGKNSILNSSFQLLSRKVSPVIKLRRAANQNPEKIKKAEDKAFKFFRKKYGERLGDEEVQGIMDGFIKGDKNDPSVRLALFSDLTRVQPISMSEMPVAYLNNPNMRIFFMLKTFTLKQIDLMRTDVTRQITLGVQKNNKRQVASGLVNMAKLIGTIGLANAGVDATRRWIAGEEIPEFGDLLTNATLRNYGLSEFDLAKMKQGNVIEAVGGLAKAPFSVLQEPVKAALGLNTNQRWIESIPVAGKTIRRVKVLREAFGLDDL